MGFIIIQRSRAVQTLVCKWQATPQCSQCNLPTFPLSWRFDLVQVQRWDTEHRLGVGPLGTLPLFVSSLIKWMMLALDGGIVQKCVQPCLKLLSANWFACFHFNAQSLWVMSMIQQKGASKLHNTHCRSANRTAPFASFSEFLLSNFDLRTRGDEIVAQRSGAPTQLEEFWSHLWSICSCGEIILPEQASGVDPFSLRRKLIAECGLTTFQPTVLCENCSLMVSSFEVSITTLVKINRIQLA